MLNKTNVNINTIPSLSSEATVILIPKQKLKNNKFFKVYANLYYRKFKCENHVKLDLLRIAYTFINLIVVNLPDYQ